MAHCDGGGKDGSRPRPASCWSESAGVRLFHLVPVVPVIPAGVVQGIEWLSSVRPPISPTVTGGGSTFRTFFEFGVEHILRGHDHLVFLLGLWLVCTRVRQLVWIVTSFTIAHSLTLAAATFDWVRLPDVWVEPLIAATIAFVGIENLVRRGEPKGRVAATFLFGLLHGFGFSNVLRAELATTPAGDLAVPLLAFNLGVEAGQLLVTAVGLPLIWLLRSRPTTQRHVVPVGSTLVALFGLFWLIERLVH